MALAVVNFFQCTYNKLQGIVYIYVQKNLQVPRQVIHAGIRAELHAVWQAGLHAHYFTSRT